MRAWRNFRPSQYIRNGYFTRGIWIASQPLVWRSVRMRIFLRRGWIVETKKGKDKIKEDGLIELEELHRQIDQVDTHGQSPWHFTVQASLDLNWGRMSIVDTKAFMLLLTHCSISGRMPPAINSPAWPAVSAGYRRSQCTPWYPPLLPAGSGNGGDEWVPAWGCPRSSPSAHYQNSSLSRSSRLPVQSVQVASDTTVIPCRLCPADVLTTVCKGSIVEDEVYNNGEQQNS